MFGRDGKPMYIEGPHDDTSRFMSALRKTVGEGNFHFVVGAPADVPYRYPCAGAPQHFLNFFPLPQGHGWFRPVFPAWCCLAARGSLAVAARSAQAVMRGTRRSARCLAFSACCRSSLASSGRPVFSQMSASRPAMCSASRTPVTA